MRGLVLGIVGALLLAGCADHATGSAKASPTSSEQEPERATCLDGLVVDDEHVPIESASIELLPGPVTTQSASDGSFSICRLAAGRYVLTVRAQGHEAFGQTVDVPRGDPLRIVLLPKPTPVPRIVVVPKVLHFTLGWTTIDSTLGRNGIDAEHCEPCSWSLPLETLPDHLVWEAQWRRNPEPPPGVGDSMYQVLRAGATFSEGEDIDAQEAGSPSSFALTRAQLLEAEALRSGSTSALSGAMYCSGNPTWPCFDQRIEIRLGLLYDYAVVPIGYTAWPPA